MSNTYFSFKRFTVHQARSGMKVGTDGVLLGAWCAMDGTDGGVSAAEEGQPVRWLDVGTGTGVVALMLAQRFEGAEIDALEPDKPSCEDARANFEASPWKDRLHLFPQRLQEYARQTQTRYDHIVTNPPYYVNALAPPDPSRCSARHAASLPYGDLLDGVKLLLKEEGLFSLILPAEEGRRFIGEATGRGWWLHRTTEVCPTLRSGVRRMLMQWGRRPQQADGAVCPVRTDRLLIHTGDGNDYSGEYRELTRDFYLRF